MFVVKNGSAIQTETFDLSAKIPLFWEIGNLKRIKPAHLSFSLATDFFRKAWSEVCHNADVNAVALKITAMAVVSAQLGAIDQKVLEQSGLSPQEILIVLEKAFDLSTDFLDVNLVAELRQTLITKLDSEFSNPPGFVEELVRQPRSGATKPGVLKLVFDAPENHAEHSAIVGIYAVLLAPHFKADVATVFLIALAHHFHNAYLPDAGFAGEELLGEFLPKIFQNLRERCLTELPQNLHEQIRQTFILTEIAESPESKAFHAADVIDRVLQMRHHADANQFNLKYALEEMELVHAGAVQKFHYDILRQAELI